MTNNSNRKIGDFESSNITHRLVRFSHLGHFDVNVKNILSFHFFHDVGGDIRTRNHPNNKIICMNTRKNNNDSSVTTSILFFMTFFRARNLQKSFIISFFNSNSSATLDTTPIVQHSISFRFIFGFSSLLLHL